MLLVGNLVVANEEVHVGRESMSDNLGSPLKGVIRR